MTTYPLNVEAPSKANPSSLNALTSVIEEQARLDEKGSLHLLKDGETEFIGLSSHSLRGSLTLLLEMKWLNLCDARLKLRLDDFIARWA